MSQQNTRKVETLEILVNLKPGCLEETLEQLGWSFVFYRYYTIFMKKLTDKNS